MIFPSIYFSEKPTHHSSSAGRLPPCPDAACSALVVVVVPAAAAAAAAAGRRRRRLVEGEQVALDGDAEVAGAQQDGEHPALEGVLEKNILLFYLNLCKKNNLS